MVALPVMAQAIRYRRHATETERQQTKWIMFGAGLMVVPASIAVVLAVVFSRSHPAVGRLVAVTAFSGFVIPIAAAIAITSTGCMTSATSFPGRSAIRWSPDSLR